MKMELIYALIIWVLQRFILVLKNYLNLPLQTRPIVSQLTLPSLLKREGEGRLRSWGEFGIFIFFKSSNYYYRLRIYSHICWSLPQWEIRAINGLFVVLSLAGIANGRLILFYFFELKKTLSRIG